MTTDSIKELVQRLRAVETRERILGFGGSETLLLFSKEAADALEALAGEVERLKGYLKDEEREKHRLVEEVSKWRQSAGNAVTTDSKEPFEMLTESDLREMYEQCKAMAGDVATWKTNCETVSKAWVETCAERDRLKAALLEIKADPIIAVAVAERALKGDA